MRTGFSECRIASVNVDYDARGNPTGIARNEATVRYDPVAGPISGTVQRDLTRETTATLEGAFLQGTRVAVQP